MSSLFEHLFKETMLPLNFDEQIFGGLMQEKIICHCGAVKDLPIQKLPEVWTLQMVGSTIQSCINSYFTNEDILFDCEGCRKPTTTKEINLIVEPSTLIIQLKRYEFDVIHQKCLKKHDSIVCPTSVSLPNGSSYTLCSVINHGGSSPENGHYTLSLYDAETNSFILLDDAKIDYSCLMNEDMGRLSYIVTYTKS